VVDIREEPGMVHLSVRDDGAGFDPDARAEGFGLLGMRERVALLGGELHIESAPGSGTLVRADIPTHRRSADVALGL